MNIADTDITINERLFERIEKKKTVLDAKRPLSKDALRKLHEDILLLHTYHSNAIEGNTLTLQETKIIIEEGMTVGGKSLREHLEATGNARAFDRIFELSKKREQMTHIHALELHDIVTKGWLNNPGQYRTHNVRIAGAKKTPPRPSKIPELMVQLFKSLSGMKLHPVITAAYLHHGFVKIHPFSDGNGRVARLLSNLFLLKVGYPPIVLKKEDRVKYYDHLRNADGGNLSPFVNFIAKALDESLTLYLAIFGGENELMPLAELARVSPYSQEYLSLRARQGVLDAVKIGNVWHSSRSVLDAYMKVHGR
jgi:Fic family protein